MVGQVMVEDEYTINVKLRRPIDAPYPLQPIIDLARDTPVITLTPPLNANLTHADASHTLNGLRSQWSINPKDGVVSSSGPRPTAEGGSAVTPWQGRRATMGMTSGGGPSPGTITIRTPADGLNEGGVPQRHSTMCSLMLQQPGSQPTTNPGYYQQTRIVSSPPVTTAFSSPPAVEAPSAVSVRLPLVQVFADDNSLVAKNRFQAPEARIDIIGPNENALGFKRAVSRPSDREDPSESSHKSEISQRGHRQQQEHKRSNSGSLFVPCIPDHCPAAEGSLYIAPVAESERWDKKKELEMIPAKGNSKRHLRRPQNDENAKPTTYQDPPAVRRDRRRGVVFDLPSEDEEETTGWKWTEAPKSIRSPAPEARSPTREEARAVVMRILESHLQEAAVRIALQGQNPCPEDYIEEEDEDEEVEGEDGGEGYDWQGHYIGEEDEYEDDYFSARGLSSSTTSSASPGVSGMPFTFYTEKRRHTSDDTSYESSVCTSPTGERGTEVCVLPGASRSERWTEVCGPPPSRSAHAAVGGAGRCGCPAEGEVGLEAGRRGELRQGGGGGGHASPQVRAADLARLTCVDLEADGSTMLVTDSALQHRDLNHNNRKDAGTSILGTSASKYLVGPHDEEAEVLAGGPQENPTYDAGYSSERSPEDEEGPLLCSSDHNSSASQSSSASSSFRIPTADEDAERTRLQKDLREGALTLHQLQQICPFISEGCIFEVTVVKNSRGLGLAVAGGVESTAPWAGLIRIKRLYPQTPAWLCGQLQADDVILAVNGVSFLGLSSHEALEFLRTTGGEVTLQVCRPPAKALEMEGVIKSPDDRLQVVSTSLTRPFCVSPSSHALLSPSSLSSFGEFEVELSKVAGSLGFTLRKQDNSILGHTIRSLVKEPALSDGRIRAGDKIISVNGTDMCSMSHEEAIAFLRTCPQTVILRLYRDASQTPVSPVSPTEPELPQPKPKALRKEARDMLSDLAFRKQSPSNSPNMMECTGSPGTLRRRRLQKTPSPDIKSVVADRWDSLVRKTEDSSTLPLPDSKHLDSIKENGENLYPSTPLPDHDPDSHSTSPSTPNTVIPQSNISSTPSLSPSNSDSIKLRRPDYLDLKSGPVSCPRKTQFTPPHEVDRSFPSSAQSLESTTADTVDSAPQLTPAQSDSPAFSHLHQGYQSVNLGALHTHEDTRLSNTTSDYSISSRDRGEGKKSGLLKWKGVVFTPEEEEVHTCLNSDGNETDSSISKSLKPKMVTLKLNRGWNSRLGFSLQPQGNVTVVTAIYANSVADKDGRLKIGDQVIKVNGQDVQNWKTDDVIDFLRKTKGDISLTVLQQPL